jgi:hypothetical protein
VPQAEAAILQRGWRAIAAAIRYAHFANLGMIERTSKGLSRPRQRRTTSIEHPSISHMPRKIKALTMHSTPASRRTDRAAMPWDSPLPDAAAHQHAPHRPPVSASRRHSRSASTAMRTMLAATTAAAPYTRTHNHQGEALT